MTSPASRATQEFMQQRKLMHDLCTLYKQWCGEIMWVKELNEKLGTNFDEVGLRDYLIKKPVNELDSLLMNAKVESADDLGEQGRLID